ncbi:MAG: type I restriction endonuclease subunit R [Candidatus Micrarchaeia archaeon]
MRKAITEDEIEQAMLELLKEQGYKVINGPVIAPEPDGTEPERERYSDVILKDRLKQAIKKINPELPEDAHNDAIRKILSFNTSNIFKNNQIFHDMLINGIDIEYKKGSRIVGDKVWLIDFQKPNNNEFLAVNQFTIIENNNNRRPDVIIFINGLPLIIIELKNPADDKATIWSAFNQLQTYKEEISNIFNYNEILICSDGNESRTGTSTSNKERFMPWKSINGKTYDKISDSQLEIMVKGMLNKETLIDLIRFFIVFKGDSKILSAYHQYNATNNAFKNTLKATKSNQKAGIVWHTQGSGKSLTMAFYSGKLIQALNNPTIVVLTDRNDLDDQLFNTFAECNNLLRQKPKQAKSRDSLKKLLNVDSGGVIFTTIQKFFPEENKLKFPTLSDRKNIIVIADEAHRSQYGFDLKMDFDNNLMRYGYAKYIRDALPNASFIGFTGTPIELSDRSTPAVFGNYVDVYDIKKSVKDNMTVQIYYESRLVKLDLKPEEVLNIDPDFEKVTEEEKEEIKERLKSKWARLKAVAGTEKRLKRIAKDIVKHFENRIINLEGKGMIVCMSRRICVELYEELIKLRPEWHSKEEDNGFIKVVMTGSATDPVKWQQHIRNKEKRRMLADRMKDPKDPLKLVIVCDMWLTGFDVPCLHTMYIDKPMVGHTLMQAIARVNRVYKDKPGGLIVDYIGIAKYLKEAMKIYTESGGKGKPVFKQEEAIKVMLSEYEIIKDIFYQFNYLKFFEGNNKDKLRMIPLAMEHILKQENGKENFLKHTKKLNKAFALSVPSDEAIEIRDEIGFFEAVRSSIVKNTLTTEIPTEELDSAIQQIVSKSIVSDRVVDIFQAVGMKKPDISLLSDEFLIEVKEMPQKNLAFEVLRKLLNDEIKIYKKKNLIKSRSFAEMLEKTIKEYTNKNIDSAEVIEELINIAKQMREDEQKGKELGLTDDEKAFYDALADNESATQVLGDETLMIIAKELLKTLDKQFTVDWTIREHVRAKLRIEIKHILRKYGYPPDKQILATETVLEQAELMGKNK